MLLFENNPNGKQPDSPGLRNSLFAQARLEGEKEQAEQFFNTFKNDPELSRIMCLASLITDPAKFRVCSQLLKIYFDSRITADLSPDFPNGKFGEYAGQVKEFYENLIKQGEIEINKLITLKT